MPQAAGEGTLAPGLAGATLSVSPGPRPNLDPGPSVLCDLWQVAPCLWASAPV